MKRWLFREPPAGSPPRGLARELSISPLLLDILWRRGLDSPEELDAYLSARLPDLVPPSRWPQFPQAAEVISKALLDGKKLAVWGDYDVDGITSSTLVLDVLEAHGLETLWHVPDRRSEGYGLNVPAIEALAAQGCGILLTVDCGISDVAAVARARAASESAVEDERVAAKAAGVAAAEHARARAEGESLKDSALNVQNERARHVERLAAAERAMSEAESASSIEAWSRRRAAQSMARSERA